MADLIKIKENEKWYSSREMCELCNVSDRTLESFNTYLTSENDYATQLIKKGGYHNSQNLYTEEALKQFQLWLMHNQTNQGRASNVVKENTTTALNIGALAIAANSSVEATQELCSLLMAKAQETQRAKELENENKQLQIEVEKSENKLQEIMQLEEQFHSSTYSATQIGNKLGISAIAVGKIARTIGLTITDEYGNTIPAVGRTDVYTVQRRCNDGTYRTGVVYSEQAKNLIEAFYLGNKNKIDNTKKKRNKKVTYTLY